MNDEARSTPESSPGPSPEGRAYVDYRRPVLRARAPLRVSFAGGGTDVAPFPEREGGCVLSGTLSQFAYSTLRPRTDGRITTSVTRSVSASTTRSSTTVSSICRRPR